MKNSYAGSETRPWPFSWIVMGAILVAIMIGSIPLLTDTSNLASAILAPLFAALGVLVEIRRRGARIGWLLIFIGAAIILGTYATVMVSAIETPPLSTTPGMFILLLVADTSWIAVVLPIIILLYVFPTGRLPSLRWRWMPWVGLGATAALLASEAFGPEIGPWDSWQIANPAGFGPPAAIEAIGSAGFLGVLVMTIGGIVAMTLRYRRSSYVGKTQIKLVLTPVALFAIFFVALIMTDFSPTATSAFTFLTTVAGVGIPVSITIAIVRHSLFDIDSVMSKTVTYGVLAIFITAVYAIVVVGIGTLWGVATNQAWHCRSLP